MLRIWVFIPAPSNLTICGRSDTSPRLSSWTDSCVNHRAPSPWRFACLSLLIAYSPTSNYSRLFSGRADLCPGDFLLLRLFCDSLSHSSFPPRTPQRKQVVFPFVHAHHEGEPHPTPPPAPTARRERTFSLSRRPTFYSFSKQLTSSLLSFVLQVSIGVNGLAVCFFRPRSFFVWRLAKASEPLLFPFPRSQEASE